VIVDIPESEYLLTLPDLFQPESPGGTPKAKIPVGGLQKSTHTLSGKSVVADRLEPVAVKKNPSSDAKDESIPSDVSSKRKGDTPVKNTGVNTLGKNLTGNTGTTLQGHDIEPLPRYLHFYWKVNAHGAWHEGIWSRETFEFTADIFGSSQSVAGMIGTNGDQSRKKGELGSPSLASSEIQLPKSFALSQNFPNPFNPQTMIKFDIPVNDRAVGVNVSVYDLRGRLIKKLVDEDMESGRYSVIWDGTTEYGETVSSGVYFYRIAAGTFTETRRMVVLK